MARRICVLVVALASGCAPPPPRALSVADLVEDPAVLQGVMARCMSTPGSSRDPECNNARLANDRLAAAAEAKRSVGHEQEFERQREVRRLREDEARRAEAAKQPRFDPYSSPVAESGVAARPE